MLPAFKPPYHWAMSDDGKRADRHGAALRALQLRRQHRQDQPRHRRGPGLGPVERPGQCRQIRHPRVRRLERLQHLRASPGFDPFSEHTDDEVAKFTETAKRVFKRRQARRRHRHHEPGAGLRRDRLPHHRRHLLGLAGPRRRLPEHPRHHAEEGADGRRQGRHRLDRDHLDRQQSGAVAARRRSSSQYVQDPKIAHTVAFAEGTFNPVAQMGNPECFELFTRRSSTRSSGTAWRRRWRARSSTTSCRTTTSCST